MAIDREIGDRKSWCQSMSAYSSDTKKLKLSQWTTVVAPISITVYSGRQAQQHGIEKARNLASEVRRGQI